MLFPNSCNSVLPGSHSSHFSLSATSKGFSPHLQKAGLALRYPLQFAPKSSFSHPEGDASGLKSSIVLEVVPGIDHLEG